MKSLSSLALTGSALIGLVGSAFAGAGGAPNPGSLLLFPIFDNTPGGTTVITVVNTNGNLNPGPGTLLAGTVDVEYDYIDGTPNPTAGHPSCAEFNRVARLTPNDSYTVSSNFDNPNAHEGYVYVFAKSPTSGAAISWNYLIGAALVVKHNIGGVFDDNPWVFKAIGADGVATDGNGNGERDLNGTEYEAGPDKIDLPRFIGQSTGVQSQLVLINLTGAVQFDATVAFQVYDDDEHAFSAAYTFRCWRKVFLDGPGGISGVFNNSFLSLVSSVGPINAPFGHMGWMRLDGQIASSTATSIANPMILANLLENIGSTNEGPGLSAASFPESYVEGTQTNGALISSSILGN
jgi:hypothetical protein